MSAAAGTASRGRRNRVSVVVALAVAAAACESDAAKLDESRERLASWAATSSVVARDWSGGVSPDRFAKAALERAQDGLDGESRKLARLAKRSAEAAALERFTKALRAQVDAAAAAVERGDRDAARLRAPALARVGESLRTRHR